jgi:CTP synthase
MPAKFIVVLGSIMSGLGKGVVASSIMKILDLYNFKVLPIKFDGYLNYDCGTMNPYRHGEVFVLSDKGEVDMDFGTYERFLNKDITSSSSMTGGKVFGEIIEKERDGKFLGQDVQIIPHLTSEIQQKVVEFASKNKLDFVVIEVGGTVGDLENGYFIEAMRQLSLKEKVIFVDVTYVPRLKTVGEQKTKPTQSAFRSLMAMGITPDFLICRTDGKMEDGIKNKLSMFTSLDENRIINDPDMDSSYQLPKYLIEQGFDKTLLALFDKKTRRIDLKKFGKWNVNVENIVRKEGKEVTVAVVGKYVELKDSYVSVKEALMHAAGKLSLRLKINWVESEILEKQKQEEILATADGIIVPGGFGKRGIEGMINAIEYARKNKIPCLGLCLGMQLMTVEFARNVCGLKTANSTEFDPKTKYNVVDILPSQVSVSKKGGTMRLGAWDMSIRDKDSIAFEAYKKTVVSERHRHRYEFNNKFRKLLENKGLKVTATTKDGKLVEIIEWKDSFGISTQSHPELKSRIEAPAPLFLSFLKASAAKNKLYN